MSAVEVIEQINQLPRAEREKVIAYARDIAARDDEGAVSGKVSDSFKRVADEVFTTNAELFRKLAQ